MTHFRPVFPPENKMPIHLAHWFPKLQWTYWSHYFFNLLNGGAPWQLYYDLHLFHLSSAQVTWFMKVTGRNTFLKERPAISCQSCSPYQPTTGPPRKWENKTPHSPPPPDENTIAQCYLAHPTNVHVPTSAAVPKLRDVGSCQAQVSSCPGARRAPAALPLTVLQRHTTYCKHLLIIKILILSLWKANTWHGEAVHIFTCSRDFPK